MPARRPTTCCAFPYHDFSLILKLLREASIDPDVSEICLTIYRLAHDSQVADALLNAIANGKRVCCVIEPRARFDEEANLRWARTMEEAGVIVSRGIDGYKTHANSALSRGRKNAARRAIWRLSAPATTTSAPPKFIPT